MARSSTNEYVPTAIRELRDPYEAGKGLLCLGWHQTDVVSWVGEQAQEGHLKDDFGTGTASKLKNKLDEADSTKEPDTDLIIPAGVVKHVRDLLRDLRRSELGKTELFPYIDCSKHLYQQGLNPHEFAHITEYVISVLRDDLNKHRMINETADFLEWYKSLGKRERQGMRSLVSAAEDSDISRTLQEEKSIPALFSDINDPYELTKGLVALGWSKDEIKELSTTEYEEGNLSGDIDKDKIDELRKQLIEGKGTLPPKTLMIIQDCLQPYRESGRLGTSELGPFFKGAINLHQNNISSDEFKEFTEYMISIFEQKRKKQNRHRSPRDILEWFKSLDPKAQRGLLALDKLTDDQPPISYDDTKISTRSMKAAVLAKDLRLAEIPVPDLA